MSFLFLDMLKKGVEPCDHTGEPINAIGSINKVRQSLQGEGAGIAEEHKHASGKIVPEISEGSVCKYTKKMLS
jgi:hypothetical protein